MMRIGRAATVGRFGGNNDAVVAVFPGLAGAEAQTAPAGMQDGAGLAAGGPTRRSGSGGRCGGCRSIRVTSRNPTGSIPATIPVRNAVRDCTATYVQEYRPSGTVITPRMSCFWRPG